MFQIKTIGREFLIDLESLKKDIENQYDFKVLSPLKDYLTGYININFPFESSDGKKIVRVFGNYSERTQAELEVTKYLNDNGIATSAPITSLNDNLTVKYKDYYYSVFDFINGEKPNYSPNTFYRIGNTIAKMQQVLKRFSLSNTNRYQDILERKKEVISYLNKNSQLLLSILPKADGAILSDQIELFTELKISTDVVMPIHSDIFNLNLLDNGETIYILDFEHIGNGPEILDSTSYLALETIANNITNQSKIAINEPTLLIAEAKAYTEGYSTEKRNIFSPEEMYNSLLFRNLVDNIYNLEKAVNKGENLYRGYMRHWNNITAFKKNKNFLLELFNEGKK